MEVVPQQQLSKPLDMAGNSEDSDVLMMNPFLDYVNEILMEEGMDEATCIKQVDHVSYQAIVGGFYDILGEHLPSNSCVDSSLSGSYDILGEHVPPPPNSCVDDVFNLHQPCYHEKGPDEQHVKVVNPNDGFYSMPNERKISLPAANGHPQLNFQQHTSEVGFTLKHDSGFQGHVMASNTPLKSQITELHVQKNGMYNSDSRLNSTGLNETSVSLSSKIDTMAQISQNVIKLNDGVLMDVMVPCWRKDAIIEGLSGHTRMGGLDQGYGNFKLLSADEEFSSKFAEVELSFEDLKLKAVYTLGLEG